MLNPPLLLAELAVESFVELERILVGRAALHVTKASDEGLLCLQIGSGQSSEIVECVGVRGYADERDALRRSLGALVVTKLVEIAGRLRLRKRFIVC